MKQKRMADCHTTEPHFAKGFCRKCYDKNYATINREKINKKSREWSKENEISRKSARLKYMYNIDFETYVAIYKAQDGKCKICNKPPTKTLHVDHNHVTGKYRGLLCGDCNRGLGLFKENIEYLNTAIKYLELFGGNENGNL